MTLAELRGYSGDFGFPTGTMMKTDLVARACWLTKLRQRVPKRE